MLLSSDTPVILNFIMYSFLTCDIFPKSSDQDMLFGSRSFRSTWKLGLLLADDVKLLVVTRDDTCQSWSAMVLTSLPWNVTADEPRAMFTGNVTHAIFDPSFG